MSTRDVLECENCCTSVTAQEGHPSNLPRVRRVLPGSTAQCLRLELEDGSTLTLSEGTRAVLLPSEWLKAPDDELSVLSLWQGPGKAAYAVPDALVPELLPYFSD